MPPTTALAGQALLVEQVGNVAQAGTLTPEYSNPRAYSLLVLANHQLAALSPVPEGRAVSIATQGHLVQSATSMPSSDHPGLQLRYGPKDLTDEGPDPDSPAPGAALSTGVAAHTRLELFLLTRQVCKERVIPFLPPVSV
jgi:hypothetical protein